MYYHRCDIERQRLRVKNAVAYLITLAVGQKMHGVTRPMGRARQDTRPPIPFCNVVVESSPPSGGNTRGDVCAPDVRIDREHPSPLLFAGVIVESGGLGWEDRVVVHNIERVGAR